MVVKERESPLERRVSDPHLLRLEAKIDKLSEAMLTLVKMEERMMFQQKTIEKLEDKVEKLTEQKDMLRETVHQVQVDEGASSGRSMIFERIVWAIVSAGLGLVGYALHATEGVVP